MWLRDRGFSVSEMARRSNVTRVTVRKIVKEELLKRNPSQNIQDDGESDE